METLQSNKLIRRETDTPVRYRVTETEGTEREGDEWKEGWLVKQLRREEREIKTKRQGRSAAEGETVTIPRVKIALDKTN